MAGGTRPFQRASDPVAYNLPAEMPILVCVCVSERVRERECVCVCVKERVSVCV